MALSQTAREVVLALARGGRLMSHRQLDGAKEYRLYPAGEEAGKIIPWEMVARLREAGLIASNKKFPAATYLLTERGRRKAKQWGASEIRPLTAKGWG